ncbi:MAG: hypothetical protein AAGJ08_17910 [Cyanobacteria bacterium P01_H01_bin.35]
MKQMMTWTKSVAMSTLLSIAAVSSIGLTSIAAVSSQKTSIVDESVTTLPTETKGEDKLAHHYHRRSYGRCRRVVTRYKNLRVRTYPWGRVVNALYPGSRVRVIGYHDGWAKISYPCYGYVYAHYLRHC